MIRDPVAYLELRTLMKKMIINDKKKVLRTSLRDKDKE